MAINNKKRSSLESKTIFFVLFSFSFSFFDCWFELTPRISESQRLTVVFLAQLLCFFASVEVHKHETDIIWNIYSADVCVFSLFFWQKIHHGIGNGVGNKRSNLVLLFMDYCHSPSAAVCACQSCLRFLGLCCTLKYLPNGFYRGCN